jgi:Cu-Zn family superoxide dismutase
VTPRAAAIAGVLLLAGCAGLRPAPTRAVADLEDARGRRVGVATFDEVAGGVRIVVEVRGLTPGEHGVHIHEVGRCEPPTFASAGGHFNPEQRQHGLENPAGPHAGDLPNLAVAADGTGRLETTTGRITLGGGPASIFDGDGSALVVHAARDDMRTDPTGNSGARAACGVIVRR